MDGSAKTASSRLADELGGPGVVRADAALARELLRVGGDVLHEVVGGDGPDPVDRIAPDGCVGPKPRELLLRVPAPEGSVHEVDAGLQVGGGGDVVHAPTLFDMGVEIAG